MEKENTPILDNLKALEARKKQVMLAKILNKIKDDARKILELKEKYNAIMEKLGVNDKEAKRIIDWINSLVELTKTDKERVAQTAAKLVEDTKEDIDEQISKTVPSMTWPIYNQGLALSNFAGGQDFVVGTSAGANGLGGTNTIMATYANCSATYSMQNGTIVPC